MTAQTAASPATPPRAKAASDGRRLAEADLLGQKVRSLRESRGLTLRGLAREAGLSPSLVSQVELDKSSPSIGTLRRIAAALDVPVATFFVGGPLSDADPSHQVAPNPRRTSGVVVHASERKHLYLPRSQLKYELLTPDLAGPIEFVWCELEPGHPETELLSHPGEEVILVLQNSLDVYVGDTCHRLVEGDSITFDSTRPHRVANPGDGTSVHVAAITPPSF
jgi:transcriptional regulator with XRE-family HTH domain